MLKSFLSLNAAPESFDRFLISKEVDFVKSHCGQYPVVSLDLKDCQGDTWEDMYHEIWECIRKMVDDHKVELADAIASLDPKELDFNKRTPPSHFSDMLSWLIKNLSKYHKKKVIVLVDEYDAPLNCAFRKNFYDKAASFFGYFYSKALKGNSALEKACLMGIVEVRGAGILSGLNNIGVYSVSHKKFSASFGFSKAEIEGLVKSETDIEKVYEWYNGYTIGGNLVINPWSFMKWLLRKQFESYWVSTETLPTVISPQISEMMMPIFQILFGGK